MLICSVRWLFVAFQLVFEFLEHGIDKVGVVFGKSKTAAVVLVAALSLLRMLGMPGLTQCLKCE